MMPGRFITECVTKVVHEPRGWFDRPSHEIVQALRYETLGTVLEVPAGFVTDFASVPMWLPLTNMLFGDRVHAAAALHDWMYARHDLMNKREADVFFHSAMLATDIPARRALYMYKGVHYFGRSSWESGPRRHHAQLRRLGAPIPGH